MLTMRNFSELSARLACHEIISQKEMPRSTSRCRRLRHDHRLAGRPGLHDHPAVPQPLVLSPGALLLAWRTFSDDVARVLADGAEYTSAITPRTFQSSGASAARIGGLQPHVRAYKHPQPTTSSGFAHLRFSPVHAGANPQRLWRNHHRLTGAGQTIAVVIDSVPADSDLSSSGRDAHQPSGSIRRSRSRQSLPPTHRATLMLK